MEVTEWDAPAYSAVQEGGVEELTTLGSRGGEGGQLQVIQRLWDPPGYGDLLLIPGTGDIGVGGQLAGGGQELVTSVGSVEEDDENHHQGGGGSAGAQILF